MKWFIAVALLPSQGFPYLEMGGASPPPSAINLFILPPWKIILPVESSPPSPPPTTYTH